MPPLPPRRIDWPRIDRKLFEAYGKSPAEISEMTLAEIATACMADSDGPPGGARAMSLAEIEQEIARAKAMTPMQRLEDARRQRDG